MTQAGINLYRCRKCGNRHLRPLLGTFNADHSEYYSDLKPVQSNFPIYPPIVKCDGCEEIIALSHDNLEMVYESEQEIPYDRTFIKVASDPGLVGYLRAVECPSLLEALSAYPQDRMLIARMKIYELFNDRIRGGKGSRFIEENDERIWLFNALELIREIDSNDIQSESSMLLKIDVLRSIGKFDKALQLIQNARGQKYLTQKILIHFESAVISGYKGIFRFSK